MYIYTFFDISIIYCYNEIDREINSRLEILVSLEIISSCILFKMVLALLIGNKVSDKLSNIELRYRELSIGNDIRSIINTILIYI